MTKNLQKDQLGSQLKVEFKFMWILFLQKLKSVQSLSSKCRVKRP